MSATGYLIAKDHVKVDPLAADNLVESEFDIRQKEVDVLQPPRVLKFPQFFVAFDQEVIRCTDYRNIGERPPALLNISPSQARWPLGEIRSPFPTKGYAYANPTFAILTPTKSSSKS